MAGLVGGVVGAVLAALGIPYIQGPPPLSPESAARVAALEAANAAQDGRLGAVEETLAPLGESVAGLESLAAGLESTVREAVETAVAAVPSRDGEAIAALGERLDGVARLAEDLDEARAAAIDPFPLLSAQSGQIETLRSALAGLDSRLASEAERLDAAIAQLADGAEGRLTAEAERLDAALAELRGALDATQAELARADERIGVLQSVRERGAAAALLAREIEGSIDAGTPFAEPLERLAAMSGGDAEIETILAALEPHATSGVATIEELRRGLQAIEAAAPTAPVAGSEWVGQIVDNVTSLVQVRERGGDAEIASGRLAEAESALRAGNLDAAIAAVEHVSGLEEAIDGAAAERWLADARARAAAVSARVALDSHIRQLLTATLD